MKRRGRGMMFALISASVFAQMHWGGDWNTGGWFWMALMMIGGGILIVVVIYLLLRSSHWYGQARSFYGESALDIAKRRYAAGEITAEEFEKIKRDIEGGGS
jgi:uncharacterized membrane protein